MNEPVSFLSRYAINLYMILFEVTLTLESCFEPRIPRVNRAEKAQYSRSSVQLSASGEKRPAVRANEREACRGAERGAEPFPVGAIERIFPLQRYLGVSKTNKPPNK